MRDLTEYGLFFVKQGTAQRHHILKGTHPDDLRSLALKARWILSDMRQQQGLFWRLHGVWSTGLEVWEFPFGDHPGFLPPDRLLASALWGAQRLTIQPYIDAALFEEGAA